MTSAKFFYEKVINNILKQLFVSLYVNNTQTKTVQTCQTQL